MVCLPRHVPKLHLDFFVGWCDGQVHVRRAKQPQLVNTIEFFASCDILHLIDDFLNEESVPRSMTLMLVLRSPQRASDGSPR